MKIDLGIWNNIFSVPTSIVDDHIVKCGSAQLKVLLYLLRYPGKDIPTQEIADKLSLNCADVSDSLNYWISEGIISNNNNSEIESDLENKISVPAFKQVDMSSISSAVNKLKMLNETELTKKNEEPISYAPRLTLKEALDRIDNNVNFKFLMDEIPKILKRNINSTDIIIIISFMDWTGIDVDLALMLINYCASVNKKTAKLIEKEAYHWLNQGIDTHEKAEKFIKEKFNLIKIQQDVMYAFHKTHLSEREKTFIKKWVTDFNYNIDMIKLAYERALTRRGEKDFAYINGILLSWYKKGLISPKEVDDENGASLSKKNIKKFTSKQQGFFTLKDSASFSLEDLHAKIEN